MKIGAKLKALLLAHSSLGHSSNRHRHRTTPVSTVSTTTTTTTVTSVSHTAMPRDRPPQASKSMLDLSGRKTSDASEPRLRPAISVLDVSGKPELRRRPHSEGSYGPMSSRQDRPASLSSASVRLRHSRPKRYSSISWAEEVLEHPDEAMQEEEEAHVSLRHSSSSTTSPPATPAATSSSSAGRAAPEMFLNGFSVAQSQSMMTLPRPVTTSNTSDDEPRGFRKKSSSALHALKNLSRSTPAMSPSASPRHSDSEGPPRVSKGTKKFMRHFADAPPSERVLNYFACALVSDILLQGTLYITPNFFAFYSKIFGHVSRLLIPVSQVASVQKERTAKIIPNAVGLHMVDGKSYVFGSLLSRDSTYKLMNHILKKAQQIGDSDSEPPSAVQVAVDDDGEDSVSASAESLMEEDQADGFLATSQVVDLVGVTATTTTPWIRDGCTATTTSSITSSSNTTATASTISTAGIPGHNLPGSPNCTTVLRRGSLSSPKAGTEEPGGAGGGAGGGVGVLFEWFTQGSLVKTCFKVGSIPVKLIGEGVKELWSLPRTSILLIISTLLLLLLFASAAFMLHRVDVLSQQLGLEKYDEYNGMYEEVLQMQQRLHAAASSEIEKTLSIQLKHIATVRQSLEALVVLFNKEPPVSTAQIPDNT